MARSLTRLVASAIVSTVRMKRQDVVDRGIDRRPDSELLTTATHITAQPLHLQSITSFQVVVP